MVRVWIGGKDIETHFKRRRDADHYLRTIEGDKARGVALDPKGARRSFGDYAQSWIKHRPLRPLTRRDYLSIFKRHLLPAFGEQSLGKINPEAVRTWWEDLTVTAGPARASKGYRLLRAIFNTAIADGLLPSNPCRIPGAGQDKTPERPLITPSLAKSIAEAITPELRAFVLLASFCGPRVGEMLALRRRHMDLLRRVVSIEQQLQEVDRTVSPSGFIFGPPKTRAGSRRIAIPPPMVPDLETHLATYAAPGAEGLLFPGSTGQPLRRRGLYREWAVARKRAGSEGIHIHDLRHLAATLAAQAGATTKELMARLGHSTPRAALIYQHAAEHRDREIADRIAGFITEAPEESLAPVAEFPNG